MLTLDDKTNSYAITGMEVFRAGDYGDKGTYTPEDLAQMAADYDPDIHEAPVTVDHMQEGEAYGWVKACHADGDRLYADIVGIVPEFAEKLKTGRLKKRSIEIYRTLSATGRPYLKAVSFLGAAAPEVKGMADPHFGEDQIGQWLSVPGGTVQFSEVGEPAPVESTNETGEQIAALKNEIERMATAMAKFMEKEEEDQAKMEDEAIKEEETKMNEEEMAAQIEALAAENKALREALEAKEMEAADAEAMNEFNEAFNAALKSEDGARVAPAEKDSLKAIFMALAKGDEVVTFSEDGKPVEVKNPRALFAEWLKARPVIVPSGQVTPFSDNVPEKRGEDGSVSVDVIRAKAAEFMAADKNLDRPTATSKAYAFFSGKR